MKGSFLFKSVASILVVIPVVAFSVFLFQTQNNLRASELTPDVPLEAAYTVTLAPSFARDVQPVLHQYCVECHGPDKAEKGLKLDTYEHLMAGSKYGPVILPRESSHSMLVSGIEQGIMPNGKDKLTPNRIKNISYWIDAGALND